MSKLTKLNLVYVLFYQNFIFEANHCLNEKTYCCVCSSIICKVSNRVSNRLLRIQITSGSIKVLHSGDVEPSQRFITSCFSSLSYSPHTWISDSWPEPLAKWWLKVRSTWPNFEPPFGQIQASDLNLCPSSTEPVRCQSNAHHNRQVSAISSVLRPFVSICLHHRGIKEENNSTAMIGLED